VLADRHTEQLQPLPVDGERQPAWATAFGPARELASSARAGTSRRSARPGVCGSTVSPLGYLAWTLAQNFSVSIGRTAGPDARLASRRRWPGCTRRWW
jgi:hypothetical protein